MDIDYFDGEHTYRDYYRDHPDECIDWCMPYVKGKNAVCVNDITYDEISAIMIEGVDIDFRDDPGAIKRLAQHVNPDYAVYRGWSDTHIAIEAMQKVGCASCPWFSVCQQMDEILE